MRQARTFLRLAAVLLPILGCTATEGAAPSDAARLAPCGAAPSCVSSDESGRLHGIEPLPLGDDPQATWRKLLSILENDASYTIVDRTADAVRATARTRVLGFIDDVDFELRPEAGEIAMRSASRVGLFDWGKNRRRLEAVRRALAGS